MFIELELSVLLVSRDTETSKMCPCPKGRQYSSRKAVYIALVRSKAKYLVLYLKNLISKL